MDAAAIPIIVHGSCLAPGAVVVAAAGDAAEVASVGTCTPVVGFATIAAALLGESCWFNMAFAYVGVWLGGLGRRLTPLPGAQPGDERGTHGRESLRRNARGVRRSHSLMPARAAMRVIVVRNFQQ